MYRSHLLIGVASTFLAFCGSALAQQSLGMTYQGKLNQNGTGYTGSADLLVDVFASPTGGASLDSAFASNIQVVNGVFTATLQFGNSAVFDGGAKYFAIRVRAPSNVGSFVTLTPRQAVTPTPYAYQAARLPNVTTSGLNVGVGKSAPTSRLHVLGTDQNVLEVESASTIGTWLNMKNTSVGGRHFAMISTGSANGEGAGKLLLNDISGGGPRITVDSQGDVGIGTVDPQAKLHVTGTMRYGNGNAVLNFTTGAAVDMKAPGSDLYVSASGGRGMLLLQTDVGATNVGIGTSNPTEKLEVEGAIRCNILKIDGGADVAENYDIAATGDVHPQPGMVVTIDPEQVGKLRVASGAYQRTVAGVISGADGVRPGLILGQSGTVADGAMPVANVGRVWCYVDADVAGPVVPGDLLTTSPTPGHAMKVRDHAQANGAVLGKAMSRLDSGKGLVLVLVSLQ